MQVFVRPVGASIATVKLSDVAAVWLMGAF